MDWALLFIVAEGNFSMHSLISNFKNINLSVCVFIDLEDDTSSVARVFNHTFITIVLVVSFDKGLKDAVNVGHVHCS